MHAPSLRLPPLIWWMCRHCYPPQSKLDSLLARTKGIRQQWFMNEWMNASPLQCSAVQCSAVLFLALLWRTRTPACHSLIFRRSHHAHFSVRLLSSFSLSISSRSFRPLACLLRHQQAGTRFLFTYSWFVFVLWQVRCNQTVFVVVIVRVCCTVFVRGIWLRDSIERFEWFD